LFTGFSTASLVLMKPEHIFTASAVVFSVLVTQLFRHQIIGEWENSFFMVPYSIAIYVAPLSCGIFAFIFSRYWYIQHKYKNTIIGASLAITIPSFFLYGIVHSVVASLVGNSQEILSLFFAYVLFGGLLFLPAIIIFGIFTAYLATKIEALTSRPT
jgi:hypothetical protein